MNYRELGAVAKVDRVIATDEECARLPYVGLDDIEKGTGWFSDGHTAEAEELLAAKFRFTPNHVLYGKLRPNLNKVALPTFGGVCTTEILPILPNPDLLDRWYLWGVLLHPEFVRWATNIVTGANLPRLSPSDLANYRIPLPPLAEQRRIAAILRVADEERRRRRYTQTLSDGLLGEVFVRMFGDLDTPRFQLGSLLAESPKNGLYLPAEMYGVGAPIIRINNFYDGVLDPPSTYLRVAATVQEVNEFGLANGEILLNRVNSLEYLGKCALVALINEPTVFESNMMRLRINCRLILPRYLVTYLSSEEAHQQILQRAKKAVNQASVNQDDVASLSIPVPSMDQQHRFVAIAASIDETRRQQQESARQSDHLFETLLQRAFMGEL